MTRRGKEKIISIGEGGATLVGDGVIVSAKPATAFDGTRFIRVDVIADKNRFAGSDFRLFDFTGKGIEQREPVPEDTRVFAVVDVKKRAREEKML